MLSMKFIPFHQIIITINVAATKITRRNTMHKYTRYILGNPSQTREKNPAKSFYIFFKRKTFHHQNDLAHKMVLKP
jgi:hypothetical protein